MRTLPHASIRHFSLPFEFSRDTGRKGDATFMRLGFAPRAPPRMQTSLRGLRDGATARRFWPWVFGDAKMITRCSIAPLTLATSSKLATEAGVSITSRSEALALLVELTDALGT
jgi:hypothetical protein